jgi:hypothetical protein
MSEPGATSGGTLHVAADEGKTLWVADELMTFKASGEDTGGAYALTDSVVPPRATRRAERKTKHPTGTTTQHPRLLPPPTYHPLAAKREEAEVKHNGQPHAEQDA